MTAAWLSRTERLACHSELFYTSRGFFSSHATTNVRCRANTLQ